MKYKFTIRLNDKDVEAEAFTLNDYLELTLSKENGTFKEKIQDVVKRCTGLNIFEMKKPEAEYVIMILWLNSLGEVNHEAEYVCECGNEFSIPINFNNVQIDKNNDEFLTYQTLKIHFNSAKVFDDSDDVMAFLKCMDYIILDDNQINISDLSDKEIDDLISIIKYDDMIDIINKLLQPTIRLGIPVKCDVCGKYHVEEFIGLNKFLKLVE